VPLGMRWVLSPDNAGDVGVANQSFWTQTYRNLKLSSKRVPQKYDRNRKTHQYQVGDTVVYCLNLASSKAQNISAKLLLRWSKLMVVAKIVRPNVVPLANPDTGVITIRAHVTLLERYVK
jgi:hypothetical protein